MFRGANLVRRYPSRANARIAFGPIHTAPSILRVRWMPRNRSAGSGTGSINLRT
jgi:hypothetical protein